MTFLEQKKRERWFSHWSWSRYVTMFGFNLHTSLSIWQWTTPASHCTEEGGCDQEYPSDICEWLLGASRLGRWNSGKCWFPSPIVTAVVLQIAGPYSDQWHSCEILSRNQPLLYESCSNEAYSTSWTYPFSSVFLLLFRGKKLGWIFPLSMGPGPQ